MDTLTQLSAQLAQMALLLAVMAPLGLLTLLGLATLLNRPLPERRLYQLMSYTFGVSLVSELSAWALMHIAARPSLELSMGSLVSMGGYTLELSLMVDPPL
jgi:hypothetical protein